MHPLTISLAALCASTASAALAQDQASPPPSAAITPTAEASQQPATTAAAPAGAQETGIEDIVVTATRREERLQQVPVTVTAITAATTRGAGIIDLRNLTQVVPGFFGGRSAGVFQPNIRGVGSTGTSVGDESNIATYIDGVYQGDGFATLADIVQVDRVEVLRGPQGTVFGRNATGGLINIITPDPSFDFKGNAAVRVGRMRQKAGDYDFRGYLTGGLSDKLAMDVSGLYRQTDDYVKDLARGGHIGGIHVADIRSKLLFKPSETARIILTGEYNRLVSSTNAVQPLDGNTAGKRFGAIVPTEAWAASLDVLPRINTRRFSGSVRTQFELGDVNLETTTGYSHNKTVQDGDSDASNILLSSFLASTPGLTSEIFSQEIRLISTGTGRFKWIVGAYGYDLNGKAGFTLVTRASPTAAIVNNVYHPDLHTRSYAGFAEGTYELVDTFFFTLGGRYTSEKRDFDQNLNGRVLFAAPSKTDFQKFTYRGALRWQFSPSANIYASYGTGFKSGVFNMTGNSPAATRPEKIKAYEAGIKADPVRWLRTNLSVYYYDYTDLQVTARDAASPAYVLQNAATAKLYGSEFEATIAPTRDLSLRGSVAYSHARYKSFPLAQVFFPLATGGNTVTTGDVSGNNLVRSPEWSFNLGGDWGHDLGAGRINLNGNLFHSSRVYFDFRNSLSQKPYTLISGELSYTDPSEQWRFSLWTQNLTNAKVFREIRAGALDTDVTYEMPRRIGLGVAYKF